MKNPITKLLMSAVVLSFFMVAFANDYVVTTYNLETASERSQLVQLSPNHLTIIDFPAIIDMVSSGNGDLIDVEVTDDRILLRPTRLAGTTDLVVRLGTDTAIFSIAIDTKTKTPRRYILKTTEQLEAERQELETEQAAQQAAAEAVARQQQAQATYDAQQAAQQVKAIPAVMRSAAPTAVPAVATASNLKTIGGMPRGLQLDITSITQGVNNTAILSYAFTNTTANPVTLHTVDFVADSRTLASYRTAVNPFTQATEGEVVPSNTTEYGTIVVYSKPLDPTTIYISGSVLETTEQGDVTHAYRDAFVF